MQFRDKKDLPQYSSTVIAHTV